MPEIDFNNLDASKWKDRRAIRKATSIKIDPEVWKMAKRRAIDEDEHVSVYIENLVVDDFYKHRSKNKERQESLFTNENK
jgi:hypothetical protein